jgi:hypothetical protein
MKKEKQIKVSRFNYFNFSILLIFGLGCFIAFTAGEPVPRFSGKAKNNCTCIIQGIGADLRGGNTRSKDWFEEQAPNAKEKYVVVYGKKEYNPRTNYPSVPEDHIIYYDPGIPSQDPGLIMTGKSTYSHEHQQKMELFKKEIREKIGNKKDVAVDIEMNLSVLAESLTDRPWDIRTKWAAQTIIDIASAQSENFPESKTKTISHSAGTDAALKAQQIQSEGGLDILDNSSSIAYSARNPDKFDPKTLLVYSKGDFGISPGGQGGLNTLKHFSEEEAIKLQNSGHPVIMQDSKTYVTVDLGGTEGHYNIKQEFGYLGAHSEHNPENSDLVLTAYMPGEKPCELPSGTTLTKVFNEINESREQKIPINMDNISRKIKESAPTDNLGGISLNAVASMPFDPDEVEEADYDVKQNSLFLIMKNYDTIYFPYMDPETIRLAYECAYKKNKKPELSIGPSPFTNNVVRLSSPGMSSVYYLGETENTYLGLAMYLADKALSNLAFGSSTDISSVSKAIPSFHSLAELFPAKYTDSADQSKYLGSQRIYLNNESVKLVLSPDGKNFQFNNISFKVHMPNGGPVENYYAAFLISHFDEIMATKQGEAFTLLIPFAKAVAIFRWLKTNNLYFRDDDLLEVPITKVYTPLYTAETTSPSPGDISPAYPTIVFGPNGPLNIIYDANKQTVITYTKGYATKILCYNGKTLDIYRDDMGLPIAYRINEKFSGAFYDEPGIGPVFYTGVVIQKEKNNMEVKITNRTIVYPENQPQVAFQKIISAFINENEWK